MATRTVVFEITIDIDDSVITTDDLEHEMDNLFETDYFTEKINPKISGFSGFHKTMDMQSETS